MASQATDKIWKGWIWWSKDDMDAKVFLSDMGVKLTYQLADLETFACEMSDDVLTRLNPYFGRFLWGLE